MALAVPGGYNANLAEHFRELYSKQGSDAATSWFYEVSCSEGYVKDPGGKRNLSWIAPSAWGDLEITINRAKPEKDPAAIAAAAVAPKDDSTCDLCIREAPQPGSDVERPYNLCIVPFELEDEPWGFQYSPYAYFDEHCIALSCEHRPMHIDQAAFTCLADLVDMFPHYMFGSNADLPIVGGSILSHDHFQGGAHVFPMEKAEVCTEFALPDFPGVRAGIVRWPMSVVRLRTASRRALLEVCEHILEVWRDWSDEEVGVVAHTGTTQHNTITPIFHRTADGYMADLVLRCNITTDEHPLGAFHPHEDKWHIKKENIGLIEVMGLAILPARLEAQLENAELSHEEISQVFAHVLEDAGVFKWDEAGRAAFARFIDSL